MYITVPYNSNDFKEPYLFKKWNGNFLTLNIPSFT